MKYILQLVRVFMTASCVTISSTGFAYQGTIDASIDASAELNDNIFLTSLPHDTVYGLIVTPELSGKLATEKWDTALAAKIKNYRYSDQSINTVDQFFDLTGRYRGERDVVSLNINHDLTSNINTDSSDFGLIARRVNTRRQSVSPQYTRLLTERLLASFSYSYSDVDYLEAEGSGYLPYRSETGSASLRYELTEITQAQFSLTAVDYQSKDDLITYQLLISRVGFNHSFSDQVKLDLVFGVSRRSGESKSIQSIDFFGNTIVYEVKSEFQDRGFVLESGLEIETESGKFNGRLSRDNTTNTRGGLDQRDALSIGYEQQVSEVGDYNIRLRVQDITSITVGSTGRDDRNVYIARLGYAHKLTERWNFSTSYQYSRREFTNRTTSGAEPESNSIYVGISYNFPPFEAM